VIGRAADSPEYRDSTNSTATGLATMVEWQYTAAKKLRDQIDADIMTALMKPELSVWGMR